MPGRKLLLLKSVVFLTCSKESHLLSFNKQTAVVITPLILCTRACYHFTIFVTVDNFSIVGREDHNIKRAIKEALYIRSNNPSLNKNIGKYHLPHIWDEVLVNITELQLS